MRLKLSLLISQFFNEKGFFGHGELDIDLADRIAGSLPDLLSYQTDDCPAKVDPRQTTAS